MTINYNVTGAERKRLAQYIADFLGCEKEYLGTPSYAYKVGYFTVSKTGEVSWESKESLEEEIKALINELEKEGFKADDEDGLIISVPLESVKLGNLTDLLEAKGNLIKKAIGTDSLAIKVSEDKVSFPWFNEIPSSDETKAYTDLISGLCKMSREQKRIQAKPTEVENERYAFRCFLLRLGFIGDEYKTDRKILLRNLEGSAAFKNGRKKEADSEVSK